MNRTHLKNTLSTIITLIRQRLRRPSLARTELDDSVTKSIFEMGSGGFSLVEIIIACALLSAFTAGILAASNFELKAVDESAKLGRVSFLLEEGVEAMRIIRDRGWTSNIEPLAVNTAYYPVFSNNWKLVTTDPGPIGGLFTRTVTIEDVYRRNSDDDIVDVSSPDPKTVDPNIKKITVTTHWRAADGSVRQEAVSTYFANLFQN